MLNYHIKVQAIEATVGKYYVFYLTLATCTSHVLHRVLESGGNLGHVRFHVVSARSRAAKLRCYEEQMDAN